MKRTSYILLTLLVMGMALVLKPAPVMADSAVPRDSIRPLLIDTTGEWYRPERIYYNTFGLYKYNGGDFFNAIDLPTVFGVGFNPTGNEKGIGYYSQLCIEWRSYKTFGWCALLDLDMHDQSYEDITFLSDWKPGVGAKVIYPKSMRDKQIETVNITTGTVYNMDLMLGAGYRIPLVKDIHDFYAHPYVNRWNLAATAQFGYQWSRLSHATQVEGGNYSLADAHYFHPVMKFNIMAEGFVAPKFCIFAQATYLQHLTTMPWDNPTTHAGMLAFSVGFASFFL